MTQNNIHGFRNINEYVQYKLLSYAKEEKNFETLFKYMFDETDNVMAEISDGYRIKKITYGEFKDSIVSTVPKLRTALPEILPDSIVGIYMSNSVEWIKMFWAILASGNRPLLMNTRFSDELIENIISDYSVSAVISDGKRFSVKTVTPDEISAISDAEAAPLVFGKEVIFMSSATTDNVKLCAYTGENFYYQICDSVNVIEKCPAIKEHYLGELKQLVLLPLYHVFGFIAVYVWFSFFSRTFVFPKDLSPSTIQNTVKKHKVTHIFAVPMVWEAVHKAVISKARARGESTYKKLLKMTGLVNKLGSLGDRLARHTLKEVRESLFGDSIKFLITGGSHINPDTLKFFNGIGYHLANGYGMTEIGITSVEFSNDKKKLNSASIGAPFGSTEYSIDLNGELLVKGKARAARIICGKEENVTDYGEWFKTKDLASFDGTRYYLNGRADDLIIDESGENLNPTLAESAIRVDGVDRLCVFPDSDNSPVLLVGVANGFSPERLTRIHTDVSDALKAANLESVIKKIVFTHESLILGNDFKVSRKKIAERYKNGSIKVFSPSRIKEHVEEVLSELCGEVTAAFASALGKQESEIGLDDSFFSELGGSSMDYFVLLGILKERFGLVLPDGSQRFTTVREFCDFIKNS